VLHKAIIKAIELEKNMPRLIKPQAHPTFGLSYVLEGGMGFVHFLGQIHFLFRRQGLCKLGPKRRATIYPTY
jgi:hypothetical protein